MNLEDCIRKGYLKRMEPDRAMTEKEIKEAEYDLGRAGKAFNEKDFKWAIVKAYYSMFHAARAVMFSFGYREK